MRGVRDTELGDAQRAARTLLNHGVVTPAVVPDREWRNLRRFADVLKDAFLELAGYRVEVERSAVSLVRRLDRLVDAPTFTTPSGRPFDRTRYALVALVLAALERLGEQTTLTDLAKRVRNAADATPGLVFDPDAYPSRLALGHAVRALEDLGAVRLTDGSREAWEQSQQDGEALYDIDRAVCRRIFPVAVRRDGGSTRFLHGDAADLGRDPERRARRQRLVRRLLEQPVVYVSDLDDAERSYLTRESRSLARDLEDLTGAQLERRREGCALVDPGRRFSDRPFPTGGAANQAALLVASRLCDLSGALPTVDAPHADERSDALRAALAEVTGDDPPPTVRARAPHPFVAEAELRAIAEAIAEEVTAGLIREHREAPSALLADALAVLGDLDLVRPVPGGVALMPALARFRELRLRAAPEIADQLTLALS